jgi:uncharacterized protein (DUF2141 family)
MTGWATPWRTLLCSIIAAAALPLGAPITSADAGPTSVALSGQVHGASGKHAVHVALWRREGFLEHPAREAQFPPGVAPAFHFEVPPGSWAVSAFEDRNDNGVLDMGLFGPKEPSGFWRPFNGWHRPKFDEVAALVTSDTPNAHITLK